uniref:Putative exonuclease n=1 Tax=viral metagenome TaxID=1070528 RepID=A0A6M3IMH1_9ZZZZ
MNFSTYIVYDFESSSANCNRCQPIQLAAIPIHSRKLEIIEDPFCSYIRPIFDKEECDKYNLDPLSEEALQVNKIKVEEDLIHAPPIRVVWDQFCSYIDQYNYKKTKWTAPVAVTYNGIRFDDIIIDRIAGGNNRHLKNVSNTLKDDINNTISSIKGDENVKLDEKIKKLFTLSRKIFSDNEPYGFGPWDKQCTLFHPRDNVDVMRLLYLYTENLQEIRSLSLDSIRDWLGLSSENAHKADVDVRQTAEIFIRFLKFTRKHALNAKFKGSFK